jgi:uncharacterized protein (TIGR03000 family)
MNCLIKGALFLTTLGALLVHAPEAQAQRKGEGKGVSRGPANVQRAPANVYRGPSYNYGNWYGNNWYSGYGYSPWGYSPAYGLSWGYPSGYYGGYYRDYSYPRSYYYSSYPTYESYPSSTYEAYPSTTYQSNYSAVQDTSTARITVRVPDANAEVWFNGVATQQRGTDRLFETPALSGGYRHSYEIRARWMGADGQMMDRTRTIDVQPGQELIVNF